MSKRAFQFYYDLKTIYKIFLLILIMSIFMGVVGYTGYYFNDKSNESIEIIFENNLKPIRWINLARVDLNANRTNVYHAIADIDYNDKAVKKYIADIDVRKERIDKNINLVKEKMSELNDKFSIEQIEKLKEHLVEYRKGREIIVKHTLTGDKIAAIEKAESMRDIAFKVVDGISSVASHIQKRAEKRNNQSKIDKDFAEKAIMTTIIFAIILSIVLGMFIALEIQGVINRLIRRMKEVSGGNLNVENFGFVSKSDLGELCSSFDGMNDILGKLNHLIKDTAKAIEEIASGSEEMTASAEQTAQGSQNVSETVQQLAKGANEQSINVSDGLNKINEMDGAVKNIQDNAKDAVEITVNAESKANAGRKQADEAVGKINQIKDTANEISSTINELGDLSTSIGEIVELIKGIANQTNLLALNAAIEAARAGEHGKGFAVVAEEVKKLAGESADATDKITEMIKVIQGKTSDAVTNMENAVKEVGEGVEIVEKTGVNLEEILDASQTVNKRVAEISEEVKGLADNSEQVVRMMENISSITEETSASAEEISSISEEQTASMEEISSSAQTLAGIVDNLNQQVSMFKV